MKTNWRILIFFFSSLLFIIGCDCDDPTDPKCSNYDPCYEVTEVKANFNFYEGIGDTLIQSDTVLNLFVTFKAEEEYDKVKWKIGDDTREFTEPQFSLAFRDTGTYKVTLMVERKPNNACFPDDDGLDTLVRYFTRLENIGDNHPIIGDYHGYLESNPEDTFTVSIFRRHTKFQDPTYPYKQFFVFNINKGCMDTEYTGAIQISDSYRALYLNGLGYTGSGCKQIEGYVFSHPDFNEVTIPFTYIDSNSTWPNYVFIHEVFHGIRQ